MEEKIIGTKAAERGLRNIKRVIEKAVTDLSKVVEENEQITAAALNDLNDAIGDVETLLASI